MVYLWDSARQPVPSPNVAKIPPLLVLLPLTVQTMDVALPAIG